MIPLVQLLVLIVSDAWSSFSWRNVKDEYRAETMIETELDVLRDVSAASKVRGYRLC